MSLEQGHALKHVESNFTTFSIAHITSNALTQAWNHQTGSSLMLPGKGGL